MSPPLSVYITVPSTEAALLHGFNGGRLLTLCGNIMFFIGKKTSASSELIYFV